LKVALVYESFGLASSLERQRVVLARGLVARGLDVHIYANVNEGTADVPGTTLHDVVRPVPPHGRFRHPWHYAQFAARATRMLREDRRKYDIIDVAGTTAWEHDVIRVHAVEAAEQRRWPMRGGRGYSLANARALAFPVLWPKVAVARLIERLQYRPDRFKLALAVTEEVAQDLREVHRVPDERIEVIPSAIAIDASHDAPSIRRALALGPDETLILFVGHDFARKGLDDAIEAVAALDEPVHLAVVGAGDPRPYERLADARGQSDRVHFLGAIDRPETAFREADLFLLPTREDVWGTVVIEAMAAGVPVVTTAVAGASAAVRSAHAGIVVDDVSVESLRAAVAQLLADPRRRQEMGEHGRAAAAKFHPSRVVEQVLAAYERVCASRR
jgi:UDP-glucose:(heptosyl)LPS alpha-1,3-glucosyltransferase